MNSSLSLARRSLVATFAVGLVAMYLPNAARAQTASSEDAALARAVGRAKVSLQRGIAAATARGKPISAKYEMEDGKLQLSVYTAKAGKFWEVVVNHQTGRIAKAEEIKEGDDLTAAKSQDEAMAKAKRSLSAAVSRALRGNKGSHVVSATAAMENGKPVATITVARGQSSKTVSEPLD